MRTLPRGATMFLIGAALLGCVANSTHTTQSTGGKPARDIRGVDADGQEFQLSDYRGQVVLLDFWANW